MAVQPMERSARLAPDVLIDQLMSVLDSSQPSVWADCEAGVVRAQMRRLSQVVARIGAHQMAAGRALDQANAAVEAGMASTGAMIAADFGGDRGAAERIVRTGVALADAQAGQTEKALADGQITTSQASIIGTALTKLPEQVTEGERRQCEEGLLIDAGHLSLTGLRRRADRLLNAVAEPEVVDAHEHDLVIARERRAWARTELVMSDNTDGTWSGRFTLPELQAQLLKTLLDGHAAPRRSHLAGDGEAGNGRASDRWGADSRATASGHTTREHAADGRRMSRNRIGYPQRLGRALAALIEHVPTDGFAHTGGAPATVAVTLDLEALAADLNEAGLPIESRLNHCADSTVGVRVSAAQARRLACEHQILPEVFGSSSLPLDLGRRSRLFSPAQRLVLAQRDQGCAFPGCDRPPSWCEAHHAGTPWSRGGPTDLDHGVLLCSFHHHQVHDQHWRIRFDPDDGTPEFRHASQREWQRHRRYLVPRRGGAPASRTVRREGSDRAAMGRGGRDDR